MWQHTNPLSDMVFDRDASYNWNKFSQGTADLSNPWSVVNPMTPPSMMHRDLGRPFKAYQRPNMNISGNPVYSSLQQQFAPNPGAMTQNETNCLAIRSPNTTPSSAMPLSCHMTAMAGSGINGMVTDEIKSPGNSVMTGSTTLNGSLESQVDASNVSSVLNMSNQIPLKSDPDGGKQDFNSNMPMVTTSMTSTKPVHVSQGSLANSTDTDNKDTLDGGKIPLKKRHHTIPDFQKDATYWEKRKKNNDSAKRSRESRRMKEEQIALRVVYLEQENLQLRTEVSLLKSEIEKLRCMLYSC